MLPGEKSIPHGLARIVSTFVLVERTVMIVRD